MSLHYLVKCKNSKLPLTADYACMYELRIMWLWG